MTARDGMPRGPLAKDIDDIVATKRALGLSYDATERALRRIDRWLAERGNDGSSLPRDVVEEWCRLRSHETERNRHHRVAEMRLLCSWLSAHGTEAWVPPKGYVRKGPRYEPHIYTDDELRRLFAAIDASRSVPRHCPFRAEVAPVFWRVLATTGMRVSEARLRRVGDLDADRRLIVVTGAKGRKDRLVPISDGLADSCRRLPAITGEGPDGWLFPVRPGEPMTLQCCYKNFRRYLEKAGIPHTGRGPRVHDLRHTHAVRLLRAWAEEGRDLWACMPYLRTMLGHESFEETAYYLRLTAESMPSIATTLATAYPGLVREVTLDAPEFH